MITPNPQPSWSAIVAIAVFTARWAELSSGERRTLALRYMAHWLILKQSMAINELLILQEQLRFGD